MWLVSAGYAVNFNSTILLAGKLDMTRFANFRHAAVALLVTLLGTAALLPAVVAQDEEDSAGPVRGSLVEDRAARKLIEAGDARYDADEPAKAVEIWQSVIERYPRSRVRFLAHMRLGNYYLDRDRAYDRARGHFAAAASDENRDDEQRAEAMLKMGICFYEARNYGKSFQVMRDVIEIFPVSPQVNEAYYYIGLGHYQLGHYSRAIDALQKVGTAFSASDNTVEKVEAGKRLFVKVEDADLAALEAGAQVQVVCKTSQGDEETVVCYPVGRNVRVILGSIVTQLGKPRPGNGILEVKGEDEVTVTYTDAHTADRKFDQPRGKTVAVVGNAIVRVTDGAYRDTLEGVVLGREVHLQVTDADLDLTDAADTAQAVVAVYREKSPEQIEAEAAAARAKAIQEGRDLETLESQVDLYQEIDRLEVVLTEARLPRNNTSESQLDAGENQTPGPQPSAVQPNATAPTALNAPGLTAVQAEQPNPPADDTQRPVQPAPTTADDSIHSGVFRASVSLVKAAEPISGDTALQAMPGDLVRVLYLDQRHRGEGTRSLVAEVRCVEGNLGAVRVTRSEISDQELLVRTKLKTASALTNIGNRYKEFGLKSNAESKYQEALGVCEEISGLARQLGGRLLEETYVQLWRIYYEMDRLPLAAAMAQRLQQEFPNSAYVDDALLQLADVSRTQREYGRAISIYQRLVAMRTSQLRGEAQFGIAQCYEAMANEAATANSNGSAQLFDRAFQEYKKVFDQFPDSGRVGEAVAKMANYYYQQRDYARAIDTFETVLNDHPDAQYLDVILFNYGRCLYRMNRLADAKRQFDQLIADFPESPLAADAKKISEALAKAGG